MLSQVINRIGGGRGLDGGTLALRLKAWWDGYEYVPPPAPAKAAGQAKTPRAGAPAPDKIMRRQWSAERVIAAEVIWGKGFVLPGGEEHALELIKPFGLTPAMTLLDMSAGIGGGIRAVANSIGAWTEGLEPSALLAELGMERSTMAGLGKKAPVHAYDPEAVELPKAKYDAVVARELGFGVWNKEGLFGAINQTLKGRGQLLVTDYVIQDDQADSPAAIAWHAAEPSSIWPWTRADYDGLFDRLGLELRVCEDMTAQYRGHIMAGWRRALEEIKARHVPPPTMLEVMEEGQLWASRLSALESGAVALYRFHLLKKKSGLLGNW